MLNEKMTTIFLIDGVKPSSIYLLRRSSTKKFAPNLYTGFGGKVEIGENHITGAKRELSEETGINDVELTEFGRMFINEKRGLYQFAGIYNGPDFNCTEGDVERIKIDNLFKLPIIPTAKTFLETWKDRGWDTKNPFTMIIERDNLEDLYSKIIKKEVYPGLLNEGMDYGHLRR